MFPLTLLPPARLRHCPRLARAVAVALVCSTASIASAAHAEENDLRYDWRVDGAITAAAFAVWGGTQLFESRLAPA
ncbi:MAG TPA: hypothetical protein VLA79_13930, partial [Polyangia bacterium]|nr:hypothetical protein [Polyangia bacterium]